MFHGAAGRIDGRADQGTTLPDGALVLRATLVGLQAAEDQVLGRGDALRQRYGLGAGIDTGAAGADIDFDQHRHAGSGIGGGGFDGGNLRPVIHADRNARDPR